MTDNSVTERRIRPIQDAIRAGNWKQALKECEKVQKKKGETSDRFLTLRTLVLLHQADDKNVQIGATETLELCSRKPPVVEIESIHQLQDALALLKLDIEEGPKLFERAVSSRPNDRELMTTWLNDSINSSHWQSAQKATTALRKAFPNDRKYEFWNILMCLLIHEDELSPEKSRNLFGTLANRMVVKLVATTPSDKAINNVEELSLLADVLTNTNDADKFIELSQGEALKSIVELDRDFVDGLLLKALEHSQKDALKHTAIKSLIRANASEPSDDDRTWNLLLSSAKTNTKSTQEWLQVVETILEGHPRHRNALLARIELSALNDEVTNDENKTIKACTAYYQIYGAKTFCFNDMMRSLKSSKSELLDLFVDWISSFDNEPDAIKQLFTVKLKLHMALRDGLNQKLLATCVAASLDLYELNSIVSMEAAYIAALGLVYLSRESNLPDVLTQANVLLHSASLRYKDYYPLRVLLLLVQRLSGQIHLSMETFWNLNIKNIQWETAGHLLLERISTLHPCQHRRADELLNPLGATDAALTVCNNSERSLGKAIREGLKNGSYSNVTDTVMLRKRLQASLAKQLTITEERKIQRLLGHQMIPKFEIQMGKKIDLRDTAFLPTYGLDDEKWKTLLFSLPRPADGWIEAMNLHETLMSYFATQLNATPAGAISFTLDTLLKASDQPVPATSGLSQAELRANSIYRTLAEMILYQEKKQERAVKGEGLIESLQSWTEACQATAVNGVKYPDTEWLHHHFVWLEILQTFAVYLTVLNAKVKTAGKNKSKSLESTQHLQGELRALIPKHSEAIRDAARSLRDGLGQAGVLGRLVDAALGRSTDDLVPECSINSRLARITDEGIAEEYCGACRESWEDALDGLLSIKVKIP